MKYKYAKVWKWRHGVVLGEVCAKPWEQKFSISQPYSTGAKLVSRQNGYFQNGHLRQSDCLDSPCPVATEAQVWQAGWPGRESPWLWCLLQLLSEVCTALPLTPRVTGLHSDPLLWSRPADINIKHLPTTVTPSGDNFGASDSLWKSTTQSQGVSLSDLFSMPSRWTWPLSEPWLNYFIFKGTSAAYKLPSWRWASDFLS